MKTINVLMDRSRRLDAEIKRMMEEAHRITGDVNEAQSGGVEA